VLLKACSLVDFARGEVLVASGHVAAGAFVVLSGRVDVTRAEQPSPPLAAAPASPAAHAAAPLRRVAATTLGAGSVLGERALLAAEPSPFRAVAAHPTAGGRTRCELRLERARARCVRFQMHKSNRR
jgi:CRP-like cAMP-binding protein